MSSIKLSTATGLSADSDKQCLDNCYYIITSLMLHFNIACYGTCHSSKVDIQGRVVCVTT